MNRAEKTNVVESLAEKFKATPHVILADYKGMTAGQATELRRKIRVVGGTYTVLKNRLARRGSEGTAVGKIADRLKGTCGLAAHATDPVALAKVVSEFAKDNPQLRLVACVVDASTVYGADGIKQLATLPGKTGAAGAAPGAHQHAGDPARPAPQHAGRAGGPRHRRATRETRRRGGLEPRDVIYEQHGLDRPARTEELDHG